MTPNQTELERFAQIMAARLGLRIELDRAGELIERRADSRREPIASYLDRLEVDRSELRALAGELTVGETYFLRHVEQFQAFAEIAVPDRLARGRLHVLSAGCSTGEEPYTLAMVLRDAAPGAPSMVYGIDVNDKAIARARAGRYSRWSLRAVPQAFELRWFRPDGKDCVIAPEIRDAVSFAHGSLLEDPELAIPDRWDIVFCRNVLMYFTEAQADAAIARFANALAPGGYLFLGHAETLRGKTDEFALCMTHGTFYYQRVPFTARSATGSSQRLAWHDDIRAAAERVRAMVEEASSPQAPLPGSARLNCADSPDRPRQPAAPLDEIRALFADEQFAEALAQLDQLRCVGALDREAAVLRALVLTHIGRFAEAREACAELLTLDASSAVANYLLALCCDSSGDTETAAQLAQIAAVLDPSFAMPRVHLGLLARRGGDREIARRELTQAIELLEREAPSRLALYGGGFSRQTLLGMCRAELAAIGARR